MNRRESSTHGQKLRTRGSSSSNPLNLNTNTSNILPLVPIYALNQGQFVPKASPEIFRYSQQTNDTQNTIILPPNYLSYEHVRSRLHQETTTTTPNHSPSSYYQHEMFPPSFNPRDSPKMSHKEKVSKWLRDVPDHSIEGTGKEGRAPESSNYSGSEFESGIDELLLPVEIGLFDAADIMEFQALRITHYVNKLYHLDTSEEVLRGEYSPVCLALEGIEPSLSKDFSTTINTNYTYNGALLNQLELDFLDVNEVSVEHFEEKQNEVVHR